MKPTPGWRTSEFWLSLLATALGILLASGILCTDHDGPVAASICKAAGAALTALTALGYSHSRATVKSASADPASYDPTKSGGS